MQARPLGLSDYMDHGDVVNELFEALVVNAGSEFSVADLKTAITNRSHWAWSWGEEENPVPSCIFVTTVQPAAAHKSLIFVGTSSDDLDYTQIHDILRQIALMLECNRMQMRTNRQVAAVLEEQGWNESYLVLECPVVGTAEEVQTSLETSKESEDYAEFEEVVEG